jgi:transcriptional regulator with XRE-family HTH domain
LQIWDQIANLQLQIDCKTVYLESQLLFSNFEAPMAIPEEKGFDGDAFYRALEAAVKAKSMTWKQVSEETGISASTLTRMAQGRRPDAASLAALSAWAHLNPSDFVHMPYKSTRAEPIAQISSLLRSDPNLDAESAEALEAIMKAAYERFKRMEK